MAKETYFCGFIELRSDDDFQAIVNSTPFDWEDAIVREMAVISPSWIDNERILHSPDIKPSLVILFLDQSSHEPGLEMLFVDVTSIEIDFSVSFNPVLRNAKIGFRWLQDQTINCGVIEASRVYGRRRGADVLGRHMQFITSTPYDEYGYPIIMR